MSRQEAKQREPSQRQLRVGEELRHALAHILARQELRDPALADVALTVTEVRATPDLKHATVFVMPLGGKHSAEVMAALKRGAAFLRRTVSREVSLRYTPELVFMLDTSFDHASRINELLHRPEVERDLEPTPLPDDGTDDGA
jgi:ribosome-binding factor A